MIAKRAGVGRGVPRDYFADAAISSYRDSLTDTVGGAGHIFVFVLALVATAATTDGKHETGKNKEPANGLHDHATR
jgi:hypothetical protein